MQRGTAALSQHMCHRSAKKGAGTRPRGPRTQLSHATAAKTATHPKLQAALIAPDRLQAGTTAVFEAYKQERKENTNIARRELFLRRVRMYWNSLVIPSPVKKKKEKGILTCFFSAFVERYYSFLLNDLRGYLNRNVYRFLAFQMPILVLM